MIPSFEIQRNWQQSFLLPQIACKAVALFLHYLYTAAFTWMLCEGVHLYSKVVEVFSEGSKMKYYYALGWGRSNFLLAGRALIQSEHDLIKNEKIKTVPFFLGLPLTIVFISACSRWGGYGNERAYVWVLVYLRPRLYLLTDWFLVLPFAMRTDPIHSRPPLLSTDIFSPRQWSYISPI